MSRYISNLLFAVAAVFLAGCAAENGGEFRRRVQSGPVFDITAYGAVDDAKVSSADAFRKAIDDCRKASGGTVRIPSGHYLTGPIDMVDNMTLQVDSNAVVLFETDRAKYPDVTSRWEGLTESGPHPLIFANGLRNIAITGAGTFDGQGATWWENMDMAEHGNARPSRPIRRRPMFLQVKDCMNVRIDGPTFINAPFWTVHLLYSENIDVGNCKLINPPTSPNTDALNTDSCRHVVVHDCYADVGDDGFGIKSGRDEEGRKVNRPTVDVTYIRCHVKHAHSVCAIGSEESGGVRHVRFLDCDGDGTDNGIRLKSMRGRGGVVEDIVASNFRLSNVRTAIVLSLRYVRMPVEPRSERTPLFRNIHIDHVTATNSNWCCRIEGLEEQPIQNVTLKNLDLSGANGVSCSYAKDITFRDVKITAKENPYKEEHSENVRRVNWTEEPSP
ncbi:MAG TPA: glycosyl hydrolase family 28 protein [Verrucomicrobiae bacterium]|nr:glycosyl hydrolase family 28 protein [Verrucomicrobiae bacterium]